MARLLSQTRLSFFLTRRLAPVWQGTRNLLGWVDRRPFGFALASSLLLGLFLGWASWRGGSTLGWLVVALVILALAVGLAWSGVPVGQWSKEEPKAGPSPKRRAWLSIDLPLRYKIVRSCVVVTLVAFPVILLTAVLYYKRSQPFREILSGSSAALLATAIVVGVMSQRLIRMLLEIIERLFFCEQDDAQYILLSLVDKIYSINRAVAMEDLVCREVEQALHPEVVGYLATDHRTGMLTDLHRRVRRLDSSSALAMLLVSTSDPLLVDTESKQSAIARLPVKDLAWLVDADFRLLVPILARDQRLLGIIGLGKKKSGLPYFRQDQQLLQTIASSVAWVLELQAGQPILNSEEPEEFELDELAKECPNCGQLYPSYTIFCASCIQRLEPSRAPFMIPGKLRFEKRIGIGGMAVVYQGFDLALGRPVAVKILRKISPEGALRLLQEARTAAAALHSHLAPVYGVETWKGSPMLVMELLEGGTLDQRIEAGRLSLSETLDLGIAMADALAQLHSADILHRDVKPSNIGFTRAGIPKLMDFGISRLLSVPFEEAWELIAGPVEESDMIPPTGIWDEFSNSSGQIVGTLAYLSPEALNGEPSNVSFDLWSLAVVLYECLVGQRIFSGKDMRELMIRIRHGRVPNFSQVLPEYDEVLGDFFRSALDPNPSRRPATAHEFRDSLKAVRHRFPAV